MEGRRRRRARGVRRAATHREPGRRESGARSWGLGSCRAGRCEARGLATRDLVEKLVLGVCTVPPRLGAGGLGLGIRGSVN